MVALAVLALIGLAAAIGLPTSRGQDRATGELVATHGLDTATEHG
jgi:type II secretory pathway pseudopilin PulG